MSLEITIKRLNAVVAVVKPDNTSSQVKRIMGDNTVSLSFELNGMVNFRIGDYAEIFGEIYRVNRMPIVDKDSRFNYVYNLRMQSILYDLRKAQYMFYDANNDLKEGDFSLTGIAENFLDLMVANINRISAGWTKGVITSTNYKTLTFSKEDCLSALQKIAAAFETEYYIEGSVINIAKQANITPHKFNYGRNKGLYKITRTQPEDTDVITRLYAFGSEKNLPAGYPSSRLRLPGGYDVLIHDLTYTTAIQSPPPSPYFDNYLVTFDWTAPIGVSSVTIEWKTPGATTWNTDTGSSTTPRTITVTAGGDYMFRFRSDNSAVTPAVTFNISLTPLTTPIFTGHPTALNYLENNTTLYGIIEADYINDDIYPHRTGTVTSVDLTNVYKMTDSGMDFDINAVLTPGVAAKVTFITGQLSGYSFDISSYNDSSKTFTLLKNKDEKTLDIPSVALHQVIGDKYVLTDIQMPQSYVDAAELELQIKAQEYLDLYSRPQFKYTIVCDPAYFRKKNIKMNIGDIVWLNDVELEVDKAIRIIGLTKSLLDEFEYQLELGETVTAETFAKLLTAQSSNSQSINNIAQTINNNALLSGTYIGTLKILQGTLQIKDITTGAGSPLVIDVDGNIFKA